MDIQQLFGTETPLMVQSMKLMVFSSQFLLRLYHLLGPAQDNRHVFFFQVVNTFVSLFSVS